MCEVLSTTSIDDVRRFFARFEHPLIDESITTESVASLLGLRPRGPKKRVTLPVREAPRQSRSQLGVGLALTKSRFRVIQPCRRKAPQGFAIGG
jgi:hypothetical protein